MLCKTNSADDFGRRPRQNFANREVRHRMPQVRRKIRQRRQHEPPLGHARVGDFERRVMHHRLAVKQDIDINRARPFRNRSSAPEFPLDSADTR